MLQPIKTEPYFDSEGWTIKMSLKMAISLASKTYFTNILIKNTLTLTFYGCLETK